MKTSFETVTVGIFLCPNRNLTTLTAAILALHPNVQVMNHGFERLREAGALKFLHSRKESDLNDFIARAIDMSAEGRRGDYGGSILHSHAFDRPALRAAYSQRFGDAAVKQDIHCLLWKDGARLREYIKQSAIDPVALAEQLPRLRFISPLRRPADHMRSLRTYYGPELPDYVRPSLPALSAGVIAEYILSAHAEFFAWQNRRPSQFLTYSDSEMGPAVIDRLCEFLGIGRDAEWLRLAATLFVNDADRTIADDDRAAIEKCLSERFGGAEEIQRWYRDYRR